MTLKVELPHSFMLSTGNIFLKTVFSFFFARRARKREKKSLFYARQTTNMLNISQRRIVIVDNIPKNRGVERKMRIKFMEMRYGRWNSTLQTGFLAKLREDLEVFLVGWEIVEEEKWRKFSLSLTFVTLSLSLSLSHGVINFTVMMIRVNDGKSWETFKFL